MDVAFITRVDCFRFLFDGLRFLGALGLLSIVAFEVCFRLPGGFGGVLFRRCFISLALQRHINGRRVSI